MSLEQRLSLQLSTMQHLQATSGKCQGFPENISEGVGQGACSQGSHENTWSSWFHVPQHCSSAALNRDRQISVQVCVPGLLQCPAQAQVRPKDHKASFTRPAQASGAKTNLNDVELGQEVTVGQRELIPIQKLPSGHSDVLRAVGIYFVWQRAV